MKLWCFVYETNSTRIRICQIVHPDTQVQYSVENVNQADL